MILSGNTIRKLGIIEPFHERTEMQLPTGGTASFGVSMAGYDLRLDAVARDEDKRLDDGRRVWALHPGEFVLASALEHFSMPNDVVGIVHDKSSWARRGLAVQNTVIEPGWRGYLTLELTNHSRDWVPIIEGVGICQVLFHFTNEPTEGYDGKYQDQRRGPVEAR